jgi:predicted nucleotidyltransferase
MNIEQLKNSGQIIFEIVVGSQAYGTSTPESDLDIRGIFLTPIENRMGLDDPVGQVSDKTNDTSFYELKKFFELASNVNPNIIEMLFPPEGTVLHISPVMQQILDSRHLFISKKARHSFAGYAYSQIKRCRGQNKWINNPKPEEPPKREDFCWVIQMSEEYFHPLCKGDRSVESAKQLTKMGRFPMRPRPLEETYMGTSPIDLTKCHVAKLEHVENTYRLYTGMPNPKGVFRSGQLVTESIPKEDEWGQFIGFLVYNEQAYKKAKDDHKNYWVWKKERNEARYAPQEAGEVDYDCYLDSETEFLTNNGWKRFDQITDSDLLGTVNSKNEFEFQNFSDKYSSLYSGTLYTYEDSRTRFTVTPNHHIYVSDCHRTRYNGFSTQYYEGRNNWHLETVEDYFKGKRSYKHVLVSAMSNTLPDYNKDAFTDDFIKILGCYLSEGSICYGRDKYPKYVYISQLLDGEVCPIMDSVTDYDWSVCDHLRNGRLERTYIIKDAELACLFADKCGTHSQTKTMPDIVDKFSTRQVNVLFDSMIAGDGHNHEKGHRVYYTTSKILADDIQALAVAHGHVVQLYGPYIYDYEHCPNRLPSYQVNFVKEQNKKVSAICKREKKQSDDVDHYSGWEVREVSKGRIVCFSVANSILITRNKNKVAIQGNSKNVMHTFRLLWSGLNILEHGEPIVRFEGERLQFLRDVRAGKYEYDELMEKADGMILDLDELYERSTIPNSVNRKAINDLYLEVIGAKE